MTLLRTLFIYWFTVGIVGALLAFVGLIFVHCRDDWTVTYIGGHCIFASQAAVAVAMLIAKGVIRRDKERNGSATQS